MNIDNYQHLTQWIYVVLMFLGAMSAKSLGITILAGLALQGAKTNAEIEIILLGYIVTYLLANFRE